MIGFSIFSPVEGLGKDVVSWLGHSISEGIGGFSSWAIGGVIHAMASTTTPDFTTWFAGPWRAMLAVVVWLSIPILFVGVGTAALRGDLTSVLKRGLGAPVLMAVGTAVAVPVTAGVLTLVNGCCGLLVDVAIGGNQGFGQGLSHLSDFALSATVASGGSGLPGLAAALIVALAGLAALAIWFVLALRGALLYLEVLAVPLALCGLYWGGTAHWIKKLIDLIVATILSQLVITMLMVLAAADLNKNQLAVNGSVSGDMTTLFLAVAFLVLGSLALPMALRHVPAATEHAAAAASQISAPGRMTYMGSRIAGTARMMGGSGGGTQAIVRQAGAAAGPLGVAASAGVGAATFAARSGVDAATGAATAAAGGEGERGQATGNTGPSGSGPEGGGLSHGSGGGAGSAATRQAATSPRQEATDLRHGRRRLAKGWGAERARLPRCEVREVPPMTEPEVLYNFGVLTKRYELVSRTAGQLAPGIAGLLVGFLMIVAGAPLPLPFAPVLVGFWFALGKIPFGRHRGARVRAVVGPLARYWYLRLAGKTHWAMPAMWLSVAVDPAATSTLERVQLDQAPPVVELGGVERNRRDRRPKTPSGRKRGGGRTRREAGEQLPPELGRLRWMAVHFDGAEAGLLFERARRQNLLTAVISVSGGDRFVFSGPDEQAAQIFHWGEVLGAMASEGSGLRRLQWVERATPQPSTVQEDWARGAMREVSPSEWADYQSLQAAIGTAAIHHDVYLGAQVETDTGKPSRRAGRGGERAGPAVRTPHFNWIATDGALAPGDRGGDAPVGRSDRARAPGAVG